MAKKRLWCLKMVNLLNSKIMRKIKSTFKIYADSESILVTEDDWNKIQNSLVQTNIKNILLIVMAIS